MRLRSVRVSWHRAISVVVLLSNMNGNIARSDRVLTLLRAASRTFAVSIEGLPPGLREQLAVAYLLLRVSDYLEDHEGIPPTAKIPLLELWNATLERPGTVDRFLSALAGVPHCEHDPEARVAHQCAILLDALTGFPPPVRRTVVRHVRATTGGMARWQAERPRVETECELDDYMHHVAGIVGYLVTDLFALHFDVIRRRRDRLMPLAREFGLALQTVNVLRGLRKDYERGWIFVPQAFCTRHGITHRDLFRASERGRAMQVVADLISKAEHHLQSSLAYVGLIPRRLHRVRLACMWPLLFAAKTLAVSRDNPAVLTAEVKIGRPSVKQIIRDTTLFGWSNAWLVRYAARLLGDGTTRARWDRLADERRAG